MFNDYSEYYFSEENLVKDLFLRRKMDSEGFIPVTLIASFHRVRSLTNDLNLVVCAIKQSEHLELVDGFKVNCTFFFFFFLSFYKEKLAE